MSGFGMPYIHSRVKVLIDGPLPWGNLLMLALLTLAFLACAARVTRQQDF
jgi:hypothetical protein